RRERAGRGDAAGDVGPAAARDPGALKAGYRLQPGPEPFGDRECLCPEHFSDLQPGACSLSLRTPRPVAAAARGSATGPIPATALPLVPSTCNVNRSSRRTRVVQDELKWAMTPLSSSKVP